MTDTTTTDPAVTSKPHPPTPAEWRAAGRHARLVQREDLRAICYWYGGLYTLSDVAEGFCCGEQGALTRIAELEPEALAFTREFTRWLAAGN